MSNVTVMISEAEQGVLCAILRDPEWLPKLNLSISDFSSIPAQDIYRVMQSLFNTGRPVDLVEICESLRAIAGTSSEEAVDALIDAVKLLHGQVTSPDAAKFYAEYLRKRSRVSRALGIATKLREQLLENDDNGIAEAITNLVALDSGARNYEWSVQEAAQHAIEEMDEALERGGMVDITTGYTDLDNLLGGWHKSDLTIIGARPAMGKTSLLLNFAARCGVPCGIISAEQPNEQIGMRFLSMQSQVSLQKMRSADLNEAEWPKLTPGLATVNEWRCWINDRPAPAIGDVIAQARKWKFERGIRILFIDYVQKIRGSDPRAKKFEQVSEVVGALKDLARDLQIPIVTLGQVKREVETRSNKRPGMADLSDSGEIEKEADQIITLYRDEVYDTDSRDKGTAELVICKNRHGATGMVPAVWRGEFLRFENFTSGPQTETEAA